VKKVVLGVDSEELACEVQQEVLAVDSEESACGVIQLVLVFDSEELTNLYNIQVHT